MPHRPHQIYSPMTLTIKPDMDALYHAHTEAIPEVGHVVTGTVISVSSTESSVDLGALGIGVVIGKEMKSGMAGKLKVGDEVQATLLTLDNEDGMIELSIRAAGHDQSWADLEAKMNSKASVPTKVLAANKGGLMVEVNGIGGFLPVSQLSGEHYPRIDDGDKNKILDALKRLIGLEINVRIMDADRVSEKLIVSEKLAQSEEEQEAMKYIRVGDVISGTVSGVVDFGCFVKFVPAGAPKGKRLEGLVHISELAWQLVDDPHSIVKAGDEVEAKVIGLDESRISLSFRALKADPWEQVESRYKAGSVVTGKVDKISHFGAFVYLDSEIHGLAHISDFAKVYPGKKIDEVVTVGESYQFNIESIDAKAHRMALIPVK